MSDFSLSSAKSHELIKLYWDELHMRTGGYELPLGSWLDNVYNVAHLAKTIEDASDDARSWGKRSVAIWGPSQTGKSTLLSSYIDANADDDGNGSAIHWGNTPVRFSGKLEPGRLVFNPYNLRSDASGCITRFTLASENTSWLDPDLPVIIRLVTVKQLMHALAAGFVSECERKNPVNGVPTVWNKSELFLLLEGIQVPETTIDRRAFERVREILDVLDLLRLMNSSRYESISAPEMSTFRVAALQHRGLLSSLEAANRFAETLFWDSWQPINLAFQSLCSCLDSFQSLVPAGKNEFYCSMEVAALLLDIEAYKRIVDGHVETLEQVHRIKRSQLADGRISLSTSPTAQGIQLFAPGRESEFRLFQGIVWELIVPLREACIRAMTQSTDPVLKRKGERLHSLLSVSDVLDFPGTSNDHMSAESALLTEASLSPGSDIEHELYTKVLKRGKTSSIVFSSSQDLNIDGFSILCHSMRPPGQPAIIENAIRVWWHSLTGRPMDMSPHREMPLNLAVTFFGELATEILAGNSKATAGDKVEKLVTKLGIVANPDFASLFALTYNMAEIDPSRIINTSQKRDANKQERESLLETFLNEQAFTDLFIQGCVIPGSDRSVREMLFEPEGGTDYLLEKLTMDARSSPRMHKISERWTALVDSWQGLLQGSGGFLPPKANMAHNERIQRISGWRDRLWGIAGSARNESDMRALSNALRRFLQMTADEIAEIPAEALEQRSFDGKAFLRRVLDGWERRLPDDGDLVAIGIVDDLTRHADRPKAYTLRTDLAEYLTSRWADELTHWMRHTFSHADDYQKREGLTRYVAIWLSDRLVGTHVLRLKPYQEMSEKLLQALFEITDPDRDFTAKASPHWRAVIDPFFSQLELVKKMTVDSRGTQPGDRQLKQLFQLDD